MPDEILTTAAPTQDDTERAKRLLAAYRKITDELGKVIVGQTDVIEQLMIGILARGHCLLEGVPGLAKTLMVRCLAQTMDLSFRRIQFTPDLMPADITGTDIIQENADTGRRQLVFLPGPIFSQIILADEINRTPPKTQAAATRSDAGAQRHHRRQDAHPRRALLRPCHTEPDRTGRYLPTRPRPGCRDRFILHVKIDYPDRQQERDIVQRTTSTFAANLAAVLTKDDISSCQEIIRRVPVPDHVLDLVLDLVRMCRPARPPDAPNFVKTLIEWGPGPRASQQLVLASKVRALLHGRYHVAVEDIHALAHPVLRHRILQTFNAEAEGVTVEQIIDRVLETASGKPGKVL